MDNLKDLSDAIHKLNEYRRVARPILARIKELSKPFVGKKIQTLQGLSSKFNEAIKAEYETLKATVVKPLPYAKWASIHAIYVENRYNDLQVKISVCFSNGSTGCSYEERTFYFGKVENGVLTEIKADSDPSCQISDMVLDYDTELAKIKEFRRLEKQAENAQDKILVNREVYKYITFDKDRY